MRRRLSIVGAVLLAASLAPGWAAPAHRLAYGGDRPAGLGSPAPDPTSRVWIGTDGRHRVLYRPRFQPAAALLEDAKVFGLKDVDLALDPVRGRLLFTALPGALPFALEAIEYLDRPTPEVLVRVSLVEVVKSDRKESGGHFLFDRSGGGEAPDSFFRTVRYGFEPDSWLRTTLEHERGFEATTLGLGRSGVGDGEGLLDQAIRGLAHEGQAEYLANTVLVCTQGVPARVESTLNLPETVFLETNAALASQTRFEKAGVVIEVTAERVGTDHVTLRLSAWLRQIVAGNGPSGPVDYPVLALREAKSTVTLADRREVAIGGMKLFRRAKSQSGLPGVYRVPGLDTLAAARLAEGESTEVVFLVRPVILTSGRGPIGAIPPGELERSLPELKPPR